MKLTGEKKEMREWNKKGNGLATGGVREGRGVKILVQSLNQSLVPGAELREADE